MWRADIELLVGITTVTRYHPLPIQRLKLHTATTRPFQGVNVFGPRNRLSRNPTPTYRQPNGDCSGMECCRRTAVVRVLAGGCGLPYGRLPPEAEVAPWVCVRIPESSPRSSSYWSPSMGPVSGPAESSPGERRKKKNTITICCFCHYYYYGQSETLPDSDKHCRRSHTVSCSGASKRGLRGYNPLWN